MRRRQFVLSLPIVLAAGVPSAAYAEGTAHKTIGFLHTVKTAKALGIAVPPTLLTRADEVIE